uniref:Uncharacterized protein n=1 Tax=Setaria italica TaxID=4555 RepID=K3YKR8_SETIT
MAQAKEISETSRANRVIRRDINETLYGLSPIVMFKYMKDAPYQCTESKIGAV